MGKLSKLLVTVAVGSAIVATSASAQTWHAASEFDLAPWSYYQRSNPGCVTPAPMLLSYYTNSLGFIGHQGVATPTIVPLVAKNPNSALTVSSTAQIPAGAVWMHPGKSGVNAKCAVIRFQTPTPGRYRVKGFIRSVDTRANTVNGYIFMGSALSPGALNLSGPMGTTLTFDRIVTALPGPPSTRTIDFALDDGGSYYFDSTQIDLTITKCKPGKSDKPGKPLECGERDDDGHGDGNH